MGGGLFVGAGKNPCPEIFEPAKRLLCLIHNKRKKPVKSIQKKNRSISERVVEFILTRTLDELSVLTVVSVAAALELNRSHMSRSFKNEKALTIEEYLFKIKIVRAAALLIEEDKTSIKQVSARMGFSRCDYFIRVFKEYFGTTPGKYRDFVLQGLS